RRGSGSTTATPTRKPWARRPSASCSSSTTRRPSPSARLPQARRSSHRLPRSTAGSSGASRIRSGTAGRSGSRSSRGHRANLGSGKPHELARVELELEAAPPRADEDRLVRERGLVDGRRQAATLSERADPTGDVAGGTLRGGPFGHHRPLADRAQVELAVGRDHEDLELAVDRGQQRLEEPARLDPERVGDGDRVVALRSCPELVTYAKANAARFVGPYGLGSPVGIRKSVGPGAVTPMAAADSTQQAPQEGVDYSGTNVQENGVDEPDLLKTNGDTLFTITGNQLESVDVSGKSPRLLDTLKLANGWSSSDLLLSGTHLLVLSRGGYWIE